MLTKKKCKKIKYRDKIAAMLALAQCRNAIKGKRQECKIYFCPECKTFHLTSQK